MSWKYVEWEVIPGLSVPMMEDSSGNLFGTNKTVAGMLGMSEDSVRHIYEDNKSEFEFLSVSNSHAKEFLKENKEVFGIQRVRQDMKLWSDDDILTFCYRATGAKAIDIRRKFTKFIKEHSKRNYVTLESHQKLQKAMESQAVEFEVFKKFVLKHIPFIEQNASLAGKSLRLQRDTKQFRTDLH